VLLTPSSRPAHGGGRWRPAVVTALLLALVAGASLPSFAAEITGKPAIIDGDTIEIAGQAIKLFGVDAPERGQTCLAADKPWRCGMEAEMALAFFVARNWVTCLEKGRGRAAQVVAVCYAGGVGGPDLGRWLVSQGWALAVPVAGQGYAAEQGAARIARKGLWRGRFVAPWVWRRGGRLDAWPRQPP
jgi:endonuclease YncB( thermonuclease family)